MNLRLCLGLKLVCLCQRKWQISKIPNIMQQIENNDVYVSCRSILMHKAQQQRMIRDIGQEQETTGTSAERRQRCSGLCAATAERTRSLQARHSALVRQRSERRAHLQSIAWNASLWSAETRFASCSRSFPLYLKQQQQQQQWNGLAYIDAHTHTHEQR